MEIEERITFTFKEVVALLVKDLQLIKLDEFTFRGTEETEAPLTLIGKRDISWDEIYQIIHAELKKVGKNPTDFKVQVSKGNFLCIGKETYITNEEEKPNPYDTILNSTLKELCSEGKIFKPNLITVRLNNALMNYVHQNPENTLKDFLNEKKSPRNFGKITMFEFMGFLDGKGIEIKKFPANNWF